MRITPTYGNNNVSNVALNGGRLTLLLVPLLVALTSEMHDILVGMHRNNSGGRQETTHDAAIILRM